MRKKELTQEERQKLLKAEICARTPYNPDLIGVNNNPAVFPGYSKLNSVGPYSILAPEPKWKLSLFPLKSVFDERLLIPGIPEDCWCAAELFVRQKYDENEMYMLSGEMNVINRSFMNYYVNLRSNPKSEAHKHIKQFHDYELVSSVRGIDFCIEHSLDYHGLIELGLADDASKNITIYWKPEFLKVPNK